MGWVAIRLVALSLVVAGCVGPPALKRQVLGYDEVTSAIEQELILLNIARADNERPVHFTATSSIAATFDWTTTANVGGSVQESPGINFLSAGLGASASENPTFSIIPLSGQEFTKRILTPFKDTMFQFLVYQGGGIDLVMRLMGAGIEVQNPDGTFVRFIENDPLREEEYREFRRLVMHLRWLNDARRLFVRTLVFEETMVEDFRDVPRSEDITKGLDKGLKWRQKPDGNYQLTRFQSGRVTVTNYDPLALSDQERFELNQKIRRNPSGFVYLDVRPGGPGGDFPIRGAIKLRSMLQMLNFVAHGISRSPEFDVAPDPRTAGAVPENPAKTLQINATESAPSANVASIRYQDRHYSVNDTRWDRTVFSGFGYLLQTAVGDVEDVGIPITIAK